MGYSYIRLSIDPGSPAGLPPAALSPTRGTTTMHAWAGPITRHRAEAKTQPPTDSSDQEAWPTPWPVGGGITVRP
uniref:Uncharacterized protein n=1 Tax=Setaria viridis TaxID=4556 RepID=A0A4U6TY88_SETVI|nr:hypothetical protein SEVIR_6G007000v2 [Setaria viridis]